MKWYEYTIETTTEGEEIVAYELSELGITNVQLMDNIHEEDLTQGREYKELLPEGMKADDGTARVRFYLDSDIAESDRDEIITDIQNALSLYIDIMNIGSCDILKTVTDESEWRDKWKEFFHEFKVGNFDIRPAWEAGDVTDHDNTILIDPGTAFGTGKHESTMLCIEGLEKYISPGDKVFDVGFGSGILSVAAFKRGASLVCGTDIADDALESAESNFSINGLGLDTDKFKIGDITDDIELFKYMMSHTIYDHQPMSQTDIEGGYDLVLANLLADIILGMTDRLFSLVRPGGILITSGIIDFRASDIEDALENVGLSIVEVREMGEWRSVVAKRV